MRKRFLLCCLMAIAAVNFISCDDDDNNDKDVVTPTNNNSNGGSTTPALSGEFIGASDCLGSPWSFDETRAGSLFDDQTIIYKFDETTGELELKFEHAVLECEAQAHVDLSFNGDTIIYSVNNADTSGIHANCICVYDIESKVKGVQSKVYYIRPAYLFDEGQVKVLELSQKSEGKL